MAINFNSGGGIVITDFGVNAYANDVAIQSDGKIIIAGQVDNGDYDVALVRYNADGSLDNSFSGDGKEITDFVDEKGNSVIVQSDGKILVAGSSSSLGSYDDDFALFRYNTDGSLDITFDGDGRVITNFGDVSANSVALQADGKIVVAGSRSNSPNLVDSEFAVARYNSNGSLDVTFSSDGFLTTSFGGNNEGRSVAIQKDGKILVAGTTKNIENYDFALARYNSDGSLDTTFDGDGKVTTDLGGREYGSSIAIQSDGKILVAGSNSSTRSFFALARYNANGSLDNSFGLNGKVLTDFSDFECVHHVVIQSDGKILVSGHAYNSSTNDDDFAMARYNTDGSLDTTFSGDGKVTTDLGGDNLAANMTLQSNGKILVAEEFDNGAYKSFALVRYNSDGSLDSTDTIAPTVSVFGPTDGATGVAVGSDIVLTFSEAIQKGTGTISIHSGSATGTVLESYDAATNNNLSVSGSTLTINPTADLVSGTHYFVTIDAGCVKDLAGNSHAGTTTDYDFTTDHPLLTPMAHNGASVMPERYSGPATAAGEETIHFQFLGEIAKDVVIGTMYNDFISVGAGVDAVNSGAGNDVVDGGIDSNFLTGGAGTDIFFSDGRGGGITWSTITDWQAGEQLSVWGWKPGTSQIIEWRQDGAEGYKGITMHADLNGDGVIDTSVTFTGITSQSQLPTPLEFADPALLWFK